MERWPNGHIGPANAAVSWGFEPGIVLAGIDAVWSATHDERCFEYIQRSVDQFVQADGSIRTYDARAYALNNILIGRQLLTLDRVAHEEKYRKAIETLHAQLVAQPRTASGGFWHAQAAPNLMLLDDTFMFAPFDAEYAVNFHHPEDLDEVARQFVLLDQHARDPKTGLLYHGWDESKSRTWINRQTGTSPNLWARGMGWYLMALVDTIPYYPKRDPHRAVLIGILRETSAALIRQQDPQSRLWYQILDKPGEKENYIESSSVMMFTYALAKGVRLGYLPMQYRAKTERAWKAIGERFVKVSASGEVTITGTVTHVALGAAPENDGSDAYYLHAPVVSDDPKGVGAFLLAATEMELGHKAAR